MYCVDSLIERLYDMGFETEENERDLLESSLKRAEQTIMNVCSCESIPEQLAFTALDMAAGEFLLAARCRSDSEMDVKSISEGDISVAFNEKSNIENLVDTLLSKGRDELIAYRRIKW